MPAYTHVWHELHSSYAVIWTQVTTISDVGFHVMQTTECFWSGAGHRFVAVSATSGDRTVRSRWPVGSTSSTGFPISNHSPKMHLFGARGMEQSDRRTIGLRYCLHGKYVVESSYLSRPFQRCFQLVSFVTAITVYFHVLELMDCAVEDDRSVVLVIDEWLGECAVRFWKS